MLVGTIIVMWVGCILDCVHKWGRGVGIVVIWDSYLFVIGNVVYYYWKGIGVFGSVSVFIYNNVVRD